TGPECAAFEAELSKYLGTEAGGQPHLVTVASCTQALELSLRALRLDPGAPVPTPSLTSCGAVGAIVHAGSRPAPVAVDEANLTDLQAAIGRAQLVALPDWQARRAALVARYDAALRAAGLADVVRVPRRHPGHAWHLYQVLVPRRDEISAALDDAGIGTSVH